MAPQVTAANVISLEEQGERLLQLYIEPQLADDFQSGAGRRALWEVLESWRGGDVA